MSYTGALKRRQPSFLALTIVAAFAVPAAPAAAVTTVSEDVPLAGGRAPLAAAFNMNPVPDRARFLSEAARLIHGNGDRKPMAPEALVARIRQIVANSSGPGELLPVPLTAAIWSSAIFSRP